MNKRVLKAFRIIAVLTGTGLIYLTGYTSGVVDMTEDKKKKEAAK